MDTLLDKKGKITGWSARWYRLRGCELVQYRRGVESSEECNDIDLKHRYNIAHIVNVSIKEKTPYILRIDFESAYHDELVPLLLKFNDVGREKGADHRKFTAWYRLLTATMTLPDREIALRPMPSNICFALYFVLQKLYRHKDLFSTKLLFGSKPDASMDAQVEKLYYSLVVNSSQYRDVKDKAHPNDLQLLANTLLYILHHMPSSLFCDIHCQPLADHVTELVDRATGTVHTNISISDTATLCFSDCFKITQWTLDVEIFCGLSYCQCVSLLFYHFAMDADTRKLTKGLP